MFDRNSSWHRVSLRQSMWEVSSPRPARGSTSVPPAGVAAAAQAPIHALLKGVRPAPLAPLLLTTKRLLGAAQGTGAASGGAESGHQAGPDEVGGGSTSAGHGAVG